LSALGTIFLPIEAYEAISDENVTIPFGCFIASAAALAIAYYIVDGYFLTGFLKKKIEIKNHGLDTRIFVEFGDLFSKDGWKAVATNDFFDSDVDEDLVSSNSLHGITIKRFWKNRQTDWQNQVNASLNGTAFEKESRSKGNTNRYPIGTAATAITSSQKFLFVALGKTDSLSNVTTANAESLIRAVRGLLQKARAKCSYEPLAIPLMGSGLARTGIKHSVLVDLMLAAIHEESRLGKVTNKITIVLPTEKERELNLKHYERGWNSNG
jgi:O-acetyl-ADP-ribose deacetylase (regulator of RNase III)